MSLMIFLMSLPLSVRGQPETSGPSSGIMAILTGNPVTKARRSEERYTKDPLAVRSLTPVFDEFPDSSLVDFSYLLDPPAGKHGFVIVGDDGYFHFEKTGKRIRFWGVTVAAAHIDIPRERIRQAAHKAVLRIGEITPSRFDPPITLELELNDRQVAQYVAWMPGVKYDGDRCVSYTDNDFFAIYKALLAMFWIAVSRLNP